MAVTEGLCKSWDSMTPAQKLTDLTDSINQTLDDLGYDPVTVELADLDDDTLGEYDSDSDTIQLDEDHVTDGDLKDVLDTAYHEAGHAIEDQDDFDSTLTEDELADYYDEAIVFVEDGDDFIRASEPYHDEVEQFAEYETELAMDECDKQSTESASSEAPWEFSMEELDAFEVPDSSTGEGDIEIEFGEPIIRDESASDDDWIIEMGEPIIRDVSEIDDSSSNLETSPGPGTAGSGP